jgi:glycosyltransferase involved in cell wall biosynthesis
VTSWTATIESLQTRRSLVHGWGTLHGAYPSMAWFERRRENGGTIERIPLLLGKTREKAGYGVVGIEFVIYGALKNPVSSADQFFVVVEGANKERTELKAPFPRAISTANWMARVAAVPWKHYLSRGIRLLGQGQSRLLLRKVRALVRAFGSSGSDPRELIKSLAAESTPLALVIDHDLGGGANLYRGSLMRRLSAEGFLPVLLSAQNGVLAYQVSVTRADHARAAYAENLPALLNALSAATFERVIFNDIVSFPEPIALVSALTAWMRQAGIHHFLFLVHDHYCICPSWLLLDNNGSFCGVPDAATCATCLPVNPTPFLQFAGGTDIESWRAAWGALLNEASEIRCFSNATRDLLVRAHREIDQRKVTVVPHVLEHVQLRRIGLKNPGWPVIGIVGAISRPKGADVVRSLADHISRTGAGARIVIIGTIEGGVRRDVVTVTGPYLQAQLPDLLEAHGVNLGFFPSIWPETFSYVTEEMMKMGLPMLAFDLGAPGERVSKYAFGEVISAGEPQAILEALDKLYDRHVRRTPPAGTQSHRRIDLPPQHTGP